MLASCLFQRYPSFRNFRVPKTLDIILPTLNEEGNIRQHLDALMLAIQTLQEKYEIVVNCYIVDAGSTDKTLEILKEYRVTVLHSEVKGRGLQYAEAIDASKGDLILMVHADAVMKENTLLRLAREFYKRPHLEWGILGHVYDKRPFKMRIIELSNRLRFCFTAIAFGDQGIFVRRSCLEECGGMPRIKLMEDVEVSLRLAPCCSRVNLGNGQVVSVRGWEEKKYGGYTAMVIRLVVSYLFLRKIGWDLEKLTDKMYKIYYEMNQRIMKKPGLENEKNK